MLNFAAQTIAALAFVGLVNGKAHNPAFDGKRVVKPKIAPKYMEENPAVNHEICSRSMTRALLQNFDPNEPLVANSGEWTDASFPFPEALRWPDMPGGANYSQQHQAENAEWLKISDVFNDSRYSMFGSQQISPKDAVQGGIGDCWFVSAASSVAKDPSRVRKIFKTEDINSAGVYSVQLFIMGIPVTVTVDEHLAFNYNNAAGLTYANVAKDGALWVPILEKAMAKLFGNYEMLVGGWMGMAVQAMTGAPFWSTGHDDFGSGEAIWTKVDEALAKNWMVGIASYPAESDQINNTIGLPQSHAYTVLGTQALSDGTKLFKIRNPWAAERYHGPWSDESDKWTDAAKAETNMVDDDDGIWYMDSDTFAANISVVHINPDVQDKYMSYWAGFELNNTHDETLTISSDDDQTLWVSAYTYDGQHTWNGDCNKFAQGTYIKFTTSVSDKAHYINYGDSHADPIQVRAGESFQVFLDADWAEGDLHQRDLSVVVWAEKSAVTLTTNHADYPHEGFPNYSLADSTKIFDLFGNEIDMSGRSDDDDNLPINNTVVVDGIIPISSYASTWEGTVDFAGGKTNYKFEYLQESEQLHLWVQPHSTADSYYWSYDFWTTVDTVN